MLLLHKKNCVGTMLFSLSSRLGNETLADAAKFERLPRPLMAGVWSLVVLLPGGDNSSGPLASLRFLVTPLLPREAPHNLTEEEALRRNAGSPADATLSAAAERDYPAIFLAAFSPAPDLEAEADADAALAGQALAERAKKSTEEFFNVAGGCVAAGKVGGLPDCGSAGWSSMAEDPKSSIRGVDEETGKMAN